MREFILRTGQRIMVLGRKEIEHGIDPKASCAIISVNDPKSDFARIDVPDGCIPLYLTFDDIMYPHLDYELADFSDIKRITNYVLRHKDRQVFVCQCEAGISRSAAIGAAIAWFLSGEDGEILNDDCLYPNRYLYAKLMLEFIKRKQPKGESSAGSHSNQ